jgi:hypothetical protein
MFPQSSSSAKIPYKCKDTLQVQRAKADKKKHFSQFPTIGSYSIILKTSIDFILFYFLTT